MRAKPREIVGAAVAITVVAVALAVIVATGSLTLPAFPALAEHPDPAIPGTVAFLRHDGRAEACLWVVDAGGGEPRRVRCGVSPWSPLEWDDLGNIVVTDDTPFDRRAVVDPETGNVVERLDGYHNQVNDRQERDDGARLAVASDEGEARLEVWETGHEARELLAAQGPRDYRFVDADWSPDGRWVLVEDSSQRLIIVDPRDGEARLLATDAGQPAWYDPSA